jgi:hypothetical protein
MLKKDIDGTVSYIEGRLSVSVLESLIEREPSAMNKLRRSMTLTIQAE